MKYKQKKKLLKNKGVTLVALVITILILVILAGVTIVTLKNTNLFNNVMKAKEKSDYAAAKEAMELKLSAINTDYEMHGNGISKLQFTADELCEDDDMEYVQAKSDRIASLEKIVLGKDVKKIYTKLKKYEYEFEINDNLSIVTLIDTKPVELAITKGEHIESFIVTINGKEKTYTENLNTTVGGGLNVKIVGIPERGYSVIEGSGDFRATQNINVNLKAKEVVATEYSSNATENNAQCATKWVAPQDRYL